MAGATIGAGAYTGAPGCGGNGGAPGPGVRQPRPAAGPRSGSAPAIRRRPAEREVRPPVEASSVALPEPSRLRPCLAAVEGSMWRANLARPSEPELRVVTTKPASGRPLPAEPAEGRWSILSAEPEEVRRVRLPAERTQPKVPMAAQTAGSRAGRRPEWGRARPAPREQHRDRRSRPGSGRSRPPVLPGPATDYRTACRTPPLRAWPIRNCCRSDPPCESPRSARVDRTPIVPDPRWPRERPTTSHHFGCRIFAPTDQSPRGPGTPRNSNG